MDSHLLRLNQMSYQQQQLLLNQQQQQRSNRNHYSNRQLDQSTVTRQAAAAAATNHQQVIVNRKASPSNILNISSSTQSSGSETNDEQQQLSSLSTSTNKTISSQQAMLHNNKTSPQQQHHQQQLMQQKHRQQQQAQQQQQQQQQQHHRQAALQSHSLTVASSGKGGGGGGGAAGGYSKAQQAGQISSADNMTTSSDNTDDLHHLAAGHGGGGYASRLTGTSRYSADGSGGLNPQSSSQQQSGSRFLLGVLFTLAELLLFTTVLLWIYWSYVHDDGLAWQNERKIQFNTHAALMLLGFIFLNGQAMLIYRSFQCCSKIYTKILHTILFVLATSAISLGLIIGYTAQENVGANSKPIMHFYSLHAWIGLVTVGLFVFQFVFGFMSFLILLCCDTATSKFREALLPIHRTFGLIIFSLAISTCLTGLLQTARSRLSVKLGKSQDYHELPEAAIIINLVGVCLILLSILMPYIIMNLGNVKRSFRSELDKHLKLSQLEMRI